MVKSAVLGYPRIGVGRAMKKVRRCPSRRSLKQPRFELIMQSIEAYWAQKASEEELQATAKAVRKERWQTIQKAGVDIIPS